MDLNHLPPGSSSLAALATAAAALAAAADEAPLAAALATPPLPSPNPRRHSSGHFACVWSSPTLIVTLVGIAICRQTPCWHALKLYREIALSSLAPTASRQVLVAARSIGFGIAVAAPPLLFVPLVLLSHRLPKRDTANGTRVTAPSSFGRLHSLLPPYFACVPSEPLPDSWKPSLPPSYVRSLAVRGFHSLFLVDCSSQSLH